MADRKVREPTKTEIKMAEAERQREEIATSDGFVSPLRETYPPLEGEPEKISIEDPEFMTFIDGEMDRLLGPLPTMVVHAPDPTPDMVAIAKEVFADMMKEETPEPEAPKEETRDMRPGKDKMMSLSGGLYLPVRRRVAWMRGEPIPRPTWGIVNTLIKYEMGTLESPRGGGPGGKMPKISGGFAVVKSEVIDDQGRIISTGYAQERSEVFPDFIEKAETAAVGRAAALAGFGTEAALDLDEGLDAENVVDAPVSERPIVITTGSGADVKVGGRVSKVTNAQVKEIGRLVRANELDPEDFAAMITKVTGEVIPSEVLEDDDKANDYLISVIRALTNAEAGSLIGELMTMEAASEDA